MARKAGVRVHSQVLELVDATNGVEFGLHDMVQVWVLRHIEFVSIVHLLKLRHQRMQHRKAGVLFVDCRLRVNDKSLGFSGPESVVESIGAILFCEGNNLDSSFDCSHLSNEGF